MDDVDARIASIGAEIDRVLESARARMRTASPGTLALYPTEHDWTTDAERAEIARLVLTLPRSGEIACAARERVQRKRTERIEAMSKSKNKSPKSKSKPLKTFEVEIYIRSRVVVEVEAYDAEQARFDAAVVVDKGVDGWIVETEAADYREARVLREVKS
jgi:hypothetical protein